ncbi:uncharacterized protein BDV17DRAFT_283861 [Aspergillus undulatus]|uniref:uncharacterized protein n=1 Tax=Aspergillus undulatus TaxID=1810928 RepID=UPI003CCD2FC3
MDSAMMSALRHLDRVSDYFRKNDQHDIANEIGRLSVQLVHQGTNSGHHAMTNHAALHEPIQQQAVLALMNEVQKKQNEPVNINSRALQKFPAANKAAAQPGSWAQIAGFTKPGPSLLSPGSLSSSSSPSLGQSQNSDSEMLSGKELVVSSPPASVVPDERAGIIRIYGSVTRDTIRDITTAIHEGPLFDIRVETNGRIRVVFQHLSQALEFFHSDQAMVKVAGYGRLGAGYRVELAEIVDWNDELRLMNQPTRQRRRLSFARKRLFADNMSPERWRQDIYSIAGPANIEFLWVFNSGNATAVFTSTAVARKVLDTVNRWKECRVAYSGVSVTYSSDPCEKTLTLVRENNRPGYFKFKHGKRSQ